MHDAATPTVDHRRAASVAAPILAAAAVSVFVLAPRAAPGLLVVLTIVPAIASILCGRTATAWLSSPIAVAWLAFGCYLILNASWSVNVVQASGKVLFYWVALLLAGLAVAGLPHITDATLQRTQKAVVAAAGIAGVFLAFEVSSRCLLHRLLFSLLPIIRPNSKRVDVVDGWVTAIEPYMLNRNVAALCFVLWPTLLMLRTVSARNARWLGLMLLAVAAAAVLPSDHATSVIALSLGTATFLGMLAAAPVVRTLIVVGWVAATLLAVPIASIAFDRQLQFAEWLPQTARNRIILWGYTADEIRHAPLFGVGLASTRDLDRARAAEAEQPHGFGYPLRTGRHGHSVFMQTWYELGGAGALLLLGIGLAGLSLLARLPCALQPATYAGFVTVATVGASSWGMWQTWFMAAYAVWIVLLALALEGARRARDPSV